MKYYFFDSRSLLQVTKLNHFANFSFIYQKSPIKSLKC